MFFIAAALTSIGAVTPGAVAIVAPIALSFAFRYHISPLLMGMMVAQGASAGAFSPLGIFDGITNGVVVRAGLPINELNTMFASFACNFVCVLLLFFVLGGRKLWHARIGANDELVTVPHIEIAKPATGPQIFGDSEAQALSGRIGREGGQGDSNRLLEDSPFKETSEGNMIQMLTAFGLVVVAVMVLAFKQDIGFISLSVGLVLSLMQPTLQKRSMAQVA